jgi:large subunit ribosomal protein L31
MKKEIHPQYGDATIACACGNVMQVRSTRKQMRINTCSACHPFYTGKSTFVDAAGRVEQFRRRYGKK